MIGPMIIEHHYYETRPSIAESIDMKDVRFNWIISHDVKEPKHTSETHPQRAPRDAEVCVSGVTSSGLSVVYGVLDYGANRFRVRAKPIMISQE